MSPRSPGSLRPLPDDIPPPLRALVMEMRLGYEKAKLTFDKLAEPTRSSRTTVHRWINGVALPGRDQAKAWAETCGTDPARMDDLWQRAAAPASSSPLPPPPDHPFRYGIPIAVTAAIVLAVGVLVLIVQVRKDSDTGSSWPSAAACAPYPARVIAPPAANTTFDIVMDIRCVPPSGREFWLFIRGDNIGDHGTTNYYPNFRLKPVVGRQVTQNFVKPADADGERFYLIVSVAAEVSATLTDKREFVNRLPPSGEIASLSVRTVISHPRRPR